MKWWLWSRGKPVYYHPPILLEKLLRECFNLKFMKIFKFLVLFLVLLLEIPGKSLKMVCFNPTFNFSDAETTCFWAQGDYEEKHSAGSSHRANEGSPCCSTLHLELSGHYGYFHVLKDISHFHSNYLSGVIMCTGIGLAIVLFCGCLYWKCKTTGPIRPLQPL